MRFSWLAAILIAAAILSGCGTATYTHDITVVIDDPSGRLGPGPVEVSIFDHQMGSSLDWARKTMGRASQDAPYETELVTTRVRTVLSEDLPGQVVVALAIPAYNDRGYFVASIAPDPAGEKTIVAPFVPYGGPGRSDEVREGPERSEEVREGPRRSEEVREGPGAAEQVAPLPVHYTSQPGEQGWHIGIRVEIPRA